ncbi:MAG TPA: hypothetical protein VGZ50_03180 [Actinomycetota bacterium]|nr:hypothetical protein [Actinomycetota bacterium]
MGEFTAGLIVGVVAGFFSYPLFWSWIAWREYQQASRRARRIDDVLQEMTRRSDEPADREEIRRRRSPLLRPVP